MRVQAMDPGTRRNGQISRTTSRASEIDLLNRKIGLETGFLAGIAPGFHVGTVRDALQ